MTFAKAPRFPTDRNCFLQERQQMNPLKDQLRRDAKALRLNKNQCKQVVRSKTAGRTKEAEAQTVLPQSKSAGNTIRCEVPLLERPTGRGTFLGFELNQNVGFRFQNMDTERRRNRF